MTDPGGQAPAPSFDDLGLRAAQQIAFEWLNQRSYAQWNELAAMTTNSASDWVRPIHGIIGVVGEEILVALGAEVEKEIAKTRVGALGSADYVDIAVHSRALRFFAEGQGNAVVIAGHGLANLVLRQFAMDPAFAAASLKPLGVKVGDFMPDAEAKSALLSLNPDTVRQLQKVAAGLTRLWPHWRMPLQLSSQTRQSGH